MSCVVDVAFSDAVDASSICVDMTERSNSFYVNPIVLLKASVTSPWVFITASSMAFPSDVFVCFNTRFDDALESMARLEASRATRISLFS